MASRLFAPSAFRALSSTTATSTILLRQSMRGFHNSTRRMNDAASAAVDTSLPLRQPIGAFRGGLFGFLLGSSLSGAAVYYYILNEYKVSNELLTEDIY
ncbi:hypothetical protein MMC31_004539, partial [Peltigera leucophlebia]|nr:hypothetical protein [Peltigera leucophlebia]